MQLRHEGLDVYQLSLEVAQWLARQPFPRGLSDLKSQGVRASTSVVLNIAEGWARSGKARANHLEIARGSAAETVAVMYIAALPGHAEYAEKMRRVDRMLEKMGG